jgi:hypothetical protein
MRLRQKCPDCGLWTCLPLLLFAELVRNRFDALDGSTMKETKSDKGNYFKAVAASPNREAADAFAANVLPIVRQIQASGATTFRAIAAALNNRGVRTARGGIWHDSTVRNLLGERADPAV